MGMCTITMKVTMVIILLLIVADFETARAVTVAQLRLIAAKNNLTGFFVFGDSSVDSGNNNHLATDSKSNFSPYGMDFLDGHPSGRFSNGKLATDYIAEALGYKKPVEAFLLPQRMMDIYQGVSFASGSSGYDNLTAQFANVLSMTHQLEYFMHYKLQLSKVVGPKKADASIQNSVFVLSLGTNDFLQNYYVEPVRRAQYTVEQYGDYLISRMHDYVKTMHSLGARRLVVVGILPFGCMPLVKTLMGSTQCDDAYNHVARSFNVKINKALAFFRTSLNMKTAYVDAYGLMQSVIQNPKKYGFEETSKGCCGTGTIEYGMTCKGLDACTDRTKYIFWDAVHPTDKMYKIIADGALNSLIANFV